MTFSNLSESLPVGILIFLVLKGIKVMSDHADKNEMVKAICHSTHTSKTSSLKIKDSSLVWPLERIGMFQIGILCRVERHIALTMSF